MPKSLITPLYITPAFPHYYLLQGSKHRNVKKSLLVCGEQSLKHPTSPPSIINLVLQHNWHLYGHTHVTNKNINNTHLNHSFPWNISPSYKSAVLTLPNMKSSDTISTYGNKHNPSVLSTLILVINDRTKGHHMCHLEVIQYNPWCHKHSWWCCLWTSLVCSRADPVTCTESNTLKGYSTEQW